MSNIALWLDESESLLKARAAEKLGLRPDQLGEPRVVRRSLDARKKGHPRWLVNVEVEVAQGLDPRVGGEVALTEAPLPPPTRVREPERMPIVVGAGPAGLFCALGLVEHGVRCLVVERGKPVGPRRHDVAKLFRSGELDPESNMSFGEGGAGAYTDGKLTTRISHPQVRKVIETFAKFGAPEKILVDGKPHVGSDLLPCAVEGLREYLTAQGCVVRWESRVDELLARDGRIFGVRLANGDVLESDRVVLAPGNSARELYEKLAADGNTPIEPKPFAIGFRVEHPQGLINELQYGRAAGHPRLPPADYRLAENPEIDGAVRGVYSFCMCPGGIVVPTPTEPEFLCTNGMSNSQRSAKFANSGIVVSVRLEDYAREGFEGPLAGLAFQRKWERAAYEAGGGAYRAPAMRVSDYMAGRPPRVNEKSTYRPGLTPSDLNRFFSESLRAALKRALLAFDRRMRGFASDAGVLIGVESRTSSPVRITRGVDFQSPTLKGLYPAGEGAGYAGGIVSSAVDGLRVAEQIAAELN